MAEHSIINLLVVDRSLTDIERINQSLRSAGYVVQSTHADQLPKINDIIASKPLDLIMVHPGERLPTIEEVRSRVEAASQNTPVIAVVDEQNLQNPVELLRAGADNLFELNNRDHLVIVVSRELEHLDARRRAQEYQERFQESEERFRALLNSSKDPIAYIHEGAHVFANTAYLRLFGYASEEELEGVTLMDMVPRNERDKLKRFLRQPGKEGAEPREMQLSGLQSSGAAIPIRIEAIPATIHNEPCLQIVVRDAGKQEGLQQALQEKLEELRNQDVLTGLYNRKFFIHYLNRLHNEGKLAGAVLYVLLTNLRGINERFGLEAVEQLTVDLARLLQSIIGEKDILARFSDSVFTVYTPNTDHDDVMALAEAICNAIKSHTSHAAHSLVSTASSTGVCPLRPDHESVNRILTEADRACETARQMGGDQVQIYRPTIEAPGEAEKQEAYIQKIKDAIAGGRLALLYQPIASLQGDLTERYKAYLHILDENRQPMPMNELMPIAERRGLSYPLDKWTIGHGLEVLTERRALGKSTTLFIHISSNSITAADFIEWLGLRLRDTGLPGGVLVFELTEASAEYYFKETKKFREQLRGLGCGLALSRFGGTDNSERILQQLAPDYIKLHSSTLIEKTFKARDDSARKALNRLIELAQETHTAVIADGVSNAPQMTAIWQLGAVLLQGDMVHEPSPNLDFDFQLFAS